MLLRMLFVTAPLLIIIIILCYSLYSVNTEKRENIDNYREQNNIADIQLKHVQFLNQRATVTKL